MKIHKQEATFQPITIVLESQEEVDQMYAILRHSEIEDTGMDNWDNQLYNYLEHLVIDFYDCEHDEDDVSNRFTKR